MIDYNGLTNSRTVINYDTTALTNQKYELRFALDSENPILQEVIETCKRNYLPYKIVDSDGRQKHVWIKGWKDS